MPWLIRGAFHVSLQYPLSNRFQSLGCNVDVAPASFSAFLLKGVKDVDGIVDHCPETLRGTKRVRLRPSVHTLLCRSRVMSGRRRLAASHFAAFAGCSRSSSSHPMGKHSALLSSLPPSGSPLASGPTLHQQEYITCNILYGARC